MRVANDREIGITIRVLAERAKTAVGKFVADSKRQFSSIGASLSSAFERLDKIKEAFTPLNQLLEIFGKIGRVVAKVGRTIGEWISAASEAERVELRLSAALQERGIYSDKLNSSLRLQAQLLQNTTGVSAEAIMQIQGSLAALGVAGNQLESATRATVGFAQVTGDLGSAATVVAKVFQGKIDTLKRYGVQVSSQAEAQAFLVGKFKLAEAQADTLATKLQILGESWGDLGEEMGRVATQSEALKTSVDVTSVTLQGLGTAIAWVRDTAGGLDGALKLALQTLGAVMPGVGPAIEAFGKLREAMFPDLAAQEAALKAEEQAFAKSIQERNAALFSFDESAKATGNGLGGLTSRLGSFDAAMHGSNQRTLERIQANHEAAVSERATADSIRERQAAIEALDAAVVAGASRGMRPTDMVSEGVSAAEPFGVSAGLRNAEELAAQAQFYSDLQGLKLEHDAIAYEQDVAANEARFQLDVEAFNQRQALLAQAGSRAKQATDYVAGSLTSLFTSALKGSDAFLAALEQIASQLLALAANSIFKTLLNFATGGASGLLGGIGSFLFGAHGGRVPQDLAPRRFAGGGLAVPNTGSDRDVFPAMLRRGEYVQTPEERASGGSGSAVVVNVSTPINTLAIPDRVAISKQFAAHVAPILDEIKASGKVTRFSRAVSGR